MGFPNGSARRPIHWLYPSYELLINKGETENLSKAERNELRVELAGYADDYRKGVIEKVAALMKTTSETEQQMSSLGKRLVQSAKEARAVARGKADASTYKVFVPTKIDVKAVGSRHNLTQEV
jgi:hypothetical protein